MTPTQTAILMLATGNAHKVQEIQAIFADLPLAWRNTSEWADVTEPEESGTTFEENALIKAHYWCKMTGLWTIADDSGLVVDVLGGRPGVRSARYAPTQAERNTRLLLELGSIPEEQRTARFVCAAALVGPDGEEVVRKGTLEGRIAFEAKGAGGFGYDPIFLPTETPGRHLAELSAEEKNRISHRGQAMSALRPKLLRCLRLG